jgi:DNA-directed RNA polymerase specialized sigma24 family protein
MFDLLYYGMYLDAKEGTPVEEIARAYRLPLHEVETRLAAARLCFEHQVQRIEFVGV